ncbi:hypothetical protein CC80DRAFT_502593 [Byssothecium circinans]|uniref:Uncharacterized protein n=1 Tax=Byssothecium circinans TaxID=147558 RepID=A0A6A5U2V2_9PLEO|nr:hypothetical protein CC80DRAFT_502593 [Byssothecium circinans]
MPPKPFCDEDPDGEEYHNCVLLSSCSNLGNHHRRHISCLTEISWHIRFNVYILNNNHSSSLRVSLGRPMGRHTKSSAYENSRFARYKRRCKWLFLDHKSVRGHLYRQYFNDFNNLTANNFATIHATRPWHIFKCEGRTYSFPTQSQSFEIRGHRCWSGSWRPHSNTDHHDNSLLLPTKTPPAETNGVKLGTRREKDGLQVAKEIAGEPVFEMPDSSVPVEIVGGHEMEAPGRQGVKQRSDFIEAENHLRKEKADPRLDNAEMKSSDGALVNQVETRS